MSLTSGFPGLYFWCDTILKAKNYFLTDKRYIAFDEGALNFMVDAIGWAGNLNILYPCIFGLIACSIMSLNMFNISFSILRLCCIGSR